MKNRKKRKIYLYLLIILGLTIGFALLSTTLKINGTANIKSNTWDIHWENVQPNTNSTVTAETPSITDNATKVSYDVNLELPGDYYEFTVDAKNDGSINGEITKVDHKVYAVVGGVTSTEPTELPSYIKYSIYYDGTEISPANGDILEAGAKETYRIRIEYDSKATILPSSDLTYKVEDEIEYTQTKKRKIPAPNDFSTDSWETITTAIENDDTSKYDVGDTKEIEIDVDGDGIKETRHLRVANNSTPDDCLNENYSQTACGFVIEFADVITTHRMNPWDSSIGNEEGNGNYGGWELSEMRSYVNNDIYNMLPTVLKNKIIKTQVVSGHGTYPTTNIYTIDKLYLFSTKEIWGKEGTVNYVGYDTAEVETRQLDYYKSMGVKTASYSDQIPGAVKRLNGSTIWWWLRTARSTDRHRFFYVHQSGNYGTEEAKKDNGGVSPAFRLGKDWVLTNSKTPIKEQKWEYYLNPRKKLQDGWYKLKDFSNNDQWYFFENGFTKLGWYTDGNNNKYYLSESDADNNGYVDANRVHSGTINIDGTDYTFDENGVCTSCN